MKITQHIAQNFIEKENRIHHDSFVIVDVDAIADVGYIL